MTSWWTVLEALEFKFVTIPIKINNEEFVILPDKKWSTDPPGKLEEGIYKYNTTNKQWQLLMKYPEIFKYRNLSASFDAKNQILYIIGVHKLICVDIKLQQMKIKDTVNVGNLPSSLFYNGNIHILGGKCSKLHLVLSNLLGNSAVISKQIACFDEWKECNTCNGSVYIKSKNCFFVFGGYDTGNNDVRLNGIWKYDITQQIWNKMSAVLPYKMDSFAWVKTNDEKYIIILGGSVNEEEWTDNIIVWNIESMVLSMSNIKCPQSALFNAVIMNNNDIHIHRVYDGIGHWKINASCIVHDDKTIINGYLRIKININLPQDICNVIYFYYIRITNIM
eukprot:158729_1